MNKITGSQRKLVKRCLNAIESSKTLDQLSVATRYCEMVIGEISPYYQPDHWQKVFRITADMRAEEIQQIGE